MKISLGSESFLSVKTDLLVVGVATTKIPDDDHLKRLDRALGAGALADWMKDDGFEAKKGQILKVPARGRIAARWVVLVGLGEKKVDAGAVRAMAARVALIAKSHKTAAIVMPIETPEALRAAADGVVGAAYRFEAYKSKESKAKGGLRAVTLLVRSKKKDELRGAIEAGRIVAESVDLVRDLVNGPPNDVNPPALAEICVAHAKIHGVRCTVMNKAKLEAERMALFLAVNKGSGFEPRLVHLVHKPADARAKVAFVGKGLTFDAGGLCIKPAKSMADMKCDMAGAATTLGIVLAAARLRLPIEVHGLIGATENLLGADAYRPGDVYKSRQGKTVEIVNTDAEGRLVLADVLDYACELKPDFLIDHATLTGACMIALGPWTAGLFGNDEELVKRYLDAAEGEGEAYWRLPLSSELKKTMDSDVADIKHIGGAFGGAITAALFLKEFIGKSRWVHLDIAGPAFQDRPHGRYPKGGTGFGVATGVRFLEDLAESRKPKVKARA